MSTETKGVTEKIIDDSNEIMDIIRNEIEKRTGLSTGRGIITLKGVFIILSKDILDIEKGLSDQQQDIVDEFCRELEKGIVLMGEEND